MPLHLCPLAMILALIVGGLCSPLLGRPVIHEILYHPGGDEDPRLEFIELFNPSSEPVSLTQWQIQGGVSYIFPEITLAPQGFLVVTGHLEIFQQRFPDTPALGPWTGKLSNSGETLQLLDADHLSVDRVRYADSGDWAPRVRGPEDREHRGWSWDQAHDGGGASLELIQPLLTNAQGLNWLASRVPGGTPGAMNSQHAIDGAPIIFDIRHVPIIPRDSDPVAIRCRIEDESPLTARVAFRTADDEAWAYREMEAGEGGTFEALLPPMEDGRIVRFFIEANDGNQWRQHPLPEAPCLYQVEADYDPEATWDPGRAPLYRLILAEEEKAELQEIGRTRAQAESNAQMNATFISQDGTGLRLRYLTGVRNRGASSRLGPPNNALVQFPGDAPWHGLAALKFNVRLPHSQAIGSVLFRRAGVEVADAMPVQLWHNRESLSAVGYAQVEPFDRQFTSRHFPQDPDGNLYQIRDDDGTGEQGDLRWRGDTVDLYRNTYFKQTQAEADDWSDLLNLIRRLNATERPDHDYVSALEEVMAIDQWLQAMAVDTLLGNREGGLTTGKGDDYALYRGQEDPRFHLVPHDLDTLLGEGRTPDADRSIWTYGELDGLTHFFTRPEIERRFLQALESQLETFFQESVIFPLLDQVLKESVSDAVRNRMKQFVTERRAGVLAQIETSLTITADLPPQTDNAEFQWRTGEGTVTLRGTFPATTSGSLRVGGVVSAALNHREGTWTAEPVPLHPGINRILVEVFSEPDHQGVLMDSAWIDVWREDPATPGTFVGGVLSLPSPETELAQLNLITRDSYYPGVPFLVRAELRDPEGQYRRDVWDSVIRLSSKREDITFEPSVIRLYNGVGSALVQVQGTQGTHEETLIDRAQAWHFLDDGSDQGTSWREPEFNDEAWRSGTGEFGYGDGDENTVIDFGEDDNAKHATTYFRTAFEILDLEEANSLSLRMKYDDAAAVYLNGAEVVRTPNLSPDARFDTYASEDVDNEDGYAVFSLSATHLRTGRNVLAVEIHQGDGGSSDISFDAALTLLRPIADPGDFELIAQSSNLTPATQNLEARRSLVSLAGTPPQRFSGPLEGAASLWQGLIQLDADVMVPENHTLTIDPGTLILVAGDPTPLGVNGTDLIVRGTLNALGSALQPITFTAADPLAPWGEIHHDHGADSDYRYVHLTRAGHAPRDGHTNTGPAFHIDDTTLDLEHVAVSDLAGKIMQADDSHLTIRQCHFARAAMGPEIDDTQLHLEASTITEMLGIYREDGITDDNDGLYLHGAAPNEPLLIEDLVIAVTDDDGLDTLNAITEVDRSIFRDCADKGASINGGRATLTRSLFVNHTYGIQAKSDGVELYVDHSTLTGNQTSLLLLDAIATANISNSILDGRINEVEGEGVQVNHSLSSQPFPGTGNVVGSPQFANQAAHDYRLLPDSPGSDRASPASLSGPHIGAFPVSEDTIPSHQGTVTWDSSQSPLRIIEDLIVPEGITLRIEPGTTIYVAPGKTLTVQGELQAVGTAHQRIRFTADPDQARVDDIHPALPRTLPHWKGLRFVDSMRPGNRLAYVDIAYAQDAMGSLSIIRSEALIEHGTFAATHLRMIYSENASARILHCRFPDMFAENERADALGLDNVSEHIKGIGTIPPGGRYLIQGNHFGTNKGHNDSIDIDSGVRPHPIVQILDNTFAGAGDELIDLGGDAYIAGNRFFNVAKDDETSDRGYANAISTGDAVNQATIVVTRNLFWDVDHAVNLKRNVAAIFEYNTVSQVHPDFVDRFGHPNLGSVVNLYVDEPFATPGEGAFLYGNVLMDIPRVFGNVDLPEDHRSSLGFESNWLDIDTADLAVGQRPTQVLQLGPANQQGPSPFVAPFEGNFSLASHSAARGAGPLGEDLGMTVAPGIHIHGEPPAVTSDRSAHLTLGGPGIFAYRYRINQGDWSDPIAIGSGFSGSETQRRASLTLTELVPGTTYQVEAIGQDYAGEWQAEAEATRSRAWRVELQGGLVQFHEVLALNRTIPLPGSDVFPDYLELWNPGSQPVSLDRWRITTGTGQAFAFPPETVLPGGGYHWLTSEALGVGLSREGETLVLLNEAGDTVDTVRFGRQAPDLSLGRLRGSQAWQAVVPSPGAPNQRALLGDPSQIHFSEWSGAEGIRLAEDFVELYNPLEHPVDISGWHLSDRPQAHPGVGHSFPEQSFLGAREAARIDQISLDRLQDTLYLSDASGAMVDFVLTGPQLSDYSQTRFGGYTSLPSPGRGEAWTPEQESRLRSLLDHLRITEIMFHPAGEPTTEFIELQNTGLRPLDLAGVRFTEGIRFTFDEQRLDPGASLVLAADEAAFRQRYGNDVPLVGIYEGRLDNGGETLTLSLPMVTEVAILRFRYEDHWEPATDGQGHSLVFHSQGASLIDPSPQAWTKADSWRRSTEIGGHPAGFPPLETQGTSYVAWSALHGIGSPDEDADGDGLSNLFEYALATDPNLPEPGSSAHLIREGSLLYLDMTIVARPDLVVTLESSADLRQWQSLGALALPMDRVQLDAPERGARYIRVRLERIPE